MHLSTALASGFLSICMFLFFFGLRFIGMVLVFRYLHIKRTKVFDISNDLQNTYPNRFSVDCCYVRLAVTGSAIVDRLYVVCNVQIKP